VISWLEKHNDFLSTFGAVARIEGFNLKSALIGGGRELQLTSGSQLVPQPTFTGLTVEAANNAVHTLAEGVYVPIYAPGLVAMIGAVDEKRDYDWSDRRDGLYRNVDLVSSRGARGRLQLTGQWIDSILPTHVGHYAVVIGAAMRDDGKGCVMLSIDRHALNAGIEPAIHRSLVMPEFY